MSNLKSRFTIQQGDQLGHSTGLVVIECCSCSIAFGIPRSLENRARKNPDIWWYCPNGHHQHYPGKTEADKLREQLEVKERNVAWLRSRNDQLAAEAKHQRQRAAGYKGQATKQKKRAAAGVVPVLQPQFR